MREALLVVRPRSFAAGCVLFALLAGGAACACAAAGCEPTVIIGRRIVPDAGAGTDAGPGLEAGADVALASDADAGDGALADADAGADSGAEADADAGAAGDADLCLQSLADAAVPDPDASVLVPWSTGFEDGFCDFALQFGYCFQTGIASYSLVTSPVHSGRYAAAFTVRGDIDGGSQVRCVEQGVFPAAAYYGAWYYIPSPPTIKGEWNLLHYQGAVVGQKLHGLWDLSLVNASDGGLRISLFDFLTTAQPDAGTPPAIPIGQWVHLEVYFKRAKDSTGEISMFQDGALALHVANLVTDDTDWGQWYVGNLADSIMPGLSTLYVDDVTIAFSQ